MTVEHSLYCHIPFCKRRCAYCDFNTYAGQEILIPAYVDALCKEIEYIGRTKLTAENAESAEKRGDVCSSKDQTVVKTIFFGGGTPSLLTAGQYGQIFRTIRTHYGVSDPEISLEANPGTVTPESLQALREIGFNRISLGVQSANPEELRQLERIHNFYEVIDSVKWAREAGFANLNLDLIYGLPEQSLDRWQATVKRTVDLAPEHFSLYALTVEDGTPFGRWAQRGLLSMPDPDLAAEMYEWAGEYLARHGYVQYEISNWAKEVPGVKCHVGSEDYKMPGYACQHNLRTWRNQPYFGFGAGAHGYVAGVRYSNVMRIRTYLDRLSPNHPIPDTQTPDHLFPASANHHYLSRREEMQETMMLGLRLVGEGVSDTAFRLRFGSGISEVFQKEVDDLTRLGLVEWVNSSLRLTHHTRLVGNQVFMRFVGD